MHPYRTHTCGELRHTDISKTVRLSGWGISQTRPWSTVSLLTCAIDYGLTQIVIQPDRQFFELCKRLHMESVITVTGTVVARSPDTVNPNLATGEIELVADAVVLEAPCGKLPLQIDTDEDGPEDTRLKYRYLDLRRDRIHHNILQRAKVIAFIRQRMQALGFQEFQTPILTSSSPEGARDYLVPSRTHPGNIFTHCRRPPSNSSSC